MAHPFIAVYERGVLDNANFAGYNEKTKDGEAMLHIEKAIIVEGKYDKNHLRKITDAPIICTHGFQLYRSKQLIQSIRHYARTKGVILLTDSDGAGFRIRRYLKQCIGESGRFFQVYIPAVEGKEKRKERYGKERLLGVEGIPLVTLEELLRPYASEKAEEAVQKVTKADLYRDGLTGGSESALLRKKLIRHLHLPERITTNALLEFLNQQGGYSLYQKALKSIHDRQNG